MSLFDFPRIHFSGNIDINVPTINNSFYWPLTLYDQLRSEGFLPPRLYFSSEAVIKAVQSSLNPTIYQDAYNGFPYIQIEAVNTIPLLRQWCMTPIGSPNSIDNAYLPYYTAAQKDTLAQQNGTVLIGHSPGYWNMYGDFGVTMSNASIIGAHVFDGKQVQHYTKESADIPDDVNAILTLAVDFDTTPASGKTTALLVETISSQSVYANIYCSNFNIYDSKQPDKILFQANPNRFAALIYSTWRVYNWFPPMSGSARFCGSVLFEDIPEAEQSELATFFKNNTSDTRIPKGMCITFTVTEVYENRYDQNYYQNHNTKPNPAQAFTVGTITPWYEGDMETGILGRNLIALGCQSVYTNQTLAGRKIPVMMTPVIASLNVFTPDEAILSIDMGNSWPESISPPYTENNPPFQPTHRGQASFDTLQLGTLNICIGNDSANIIASIAVDPVSNPLTEVRKQGCIFDFLISGSAKISEIQNNDLSVYLSQSGQQSVLALQESPYMFSSDQKGIYAEEGDSPSKGYFVNNAVREPCRLRIYQRGVPVTTPVQVLMAECTVPEAGNDPPGAFNTPYTTLSLKDNDIITIPGNNLQLSNSAIYYFVYNGQYGNNNPIPDFVVNNNYTIMDTGAFVVLRVHPKRNYNKYLDTSDPDYTPPTYQVVYDEVFSLYDIVYPVMALVHPFTEAIWNNGTLAGLVEQRTDMSLWTNILYMPRSRELSINQRKLLKAWADTFNSDPV